MPKYRDITGRTFDRLTAMHPTEPNRIGQMQWLFQCECGNQKIIPAAQVLSKQVRSCGCLRREMNRERQAALARASADANRKPIKCHGVARQLHDARISSGLTQEALADATGYSTCAIRNMETGKTRPSFDLVSDIAQAFGMRLVLEKQNFANSGSIAPDRVDADHSATCNLAEGPPLTKETITA